MANTDQFTRKFLEVSRRNNNKGIIAPRVVFLKRLLDATTISPKTGQIFPRGLS